MAIIDLTSTDPTGFSYVDFQAIKAVLDGLDDGSELQTLLDAKASISNVLTLDNTDAFTPDADYEPATKKYVDDNTIGDVIDDTTPELGGELDCGAHSIGFTLQSDTGDGTTTIDWKLGNKYKFTFGAQNDTFTFTAPSNPCSLTLILVQDGTGSRTATWPGTVKWADGSAPTLTTDANAVDIVSFIYDGTNYYGSGALDFS